MPHHKSLGKLKAKKKKKKKVKRGQKRKPRFVGILSWNCTFGTPGPQLQL
jgi:hypothetical protein